MYEQYFGLREKPFSLTPDPDFLFVNKHFRGALDNVIYGIKRQEGFTTILGDVGTGKTTLCWALLGKLNKNVRTALILNPLLNEEDMLKAILQDFGVRPRKHGPVPESDEVESPVDPDWMNGLSRKELIDELNYFLLAGSENGVFNILILDEAQNLSLPVLEQLRVLSNLETAKKKLLQIIFVGQLEFRQKLALPQLRQLDQRITIRYSLKPLSKQDTAQYIEHRLTKAGSKGAVRFTPGALQRIYVFSRGYPRLINIICDRSLLAGYSARARVITSKMVNQAARGIRGTEKGVRVLIIRPWKLIVSLAVFAVLALLTVLLIWSWRGPLPHQSDNLPAPSSVLAAAKPSTDSPPPAGASAPSPEAGASAGKIQALPSSTAQTPVPKPAVPAIARAHDIPAAVRSTTPDPTAPEAARGESQAGATTREAAVRTPSTEFAGRYLLQVHSLRSKDQADYALADLRRSGYSAFVRIEEVGKGESWYVVYAGPYDTAAGAQAGASALGQRGGIHPIVRGY